MSLDISINKTPSIRRAVFTDPSKIWPGLLFRPVHCERGDLRGHFLHHLWRRREGVQEKCGPWGRDKDSVPWRLLRGTGNEDETSTSMALVSCSQKYFERSETYFKLSQSWLLIDFKLISHRFSLWKYTAYQRKTRRLYVDCLLFPSKSLWD